MPDEHITFEMVGLPPSPNRTRRFGHWAQRSKLDAQWRGDAHRLAVDARNRSGFRDFPWREVSVAITFYLPDYRRRDPHNLAASEAIKAALDGGLVDSGLVGDDDARHVVRLGPFDVEHRPRKPGFRVTVTRLA